MTLGQYCILVPGERGKTVLTERLGEGTGSPVLVSSLQEMKAAFREHGKHYPNKRLEVVAYGGRVTSPSRGPFMFSDKPVAAYHTGASQIEVLGWIPGHTPGGRLDFEDYRLTKALAERPVSLINLN